VTLRAPKRVALAARPTQSLKAYDYYLRGRYLWNERGEENFRRALAYFEQAIALDSSYAPAWAGAADARLSLLGWVGEPFREEFPRAKAAAERAVLLDSSVAEAHATLARVHAYAWEWEAALREARRAVELNPSDAPARHGYSHWLVIVGRLAEAEAQSNRMLELDPLGPVTSLHPCWHYFSTRQYDRAIASCRRGLELHPRQPDAHSKLALVYLVRGELDSAAVEVEREIEISPTSPEYVAQFANVYAAAGRTETAWAVLRRIRSQTPAGKWPAFDAACAYAALGDADRAFAELEAAYAARRPELVYLRTDPRLDPLRADPRFAPLVRRMRLQ